MSHTDIALTTVFCAGQVITVAVLAWRARRARQPKVPYLTDPAALAALRTIERYRGQR